MRKRRKTRRRTEEEEAAVAFVRRGRRVEFSRSGCLAVLLGSARGRVAVWQCAKLACDYGGVAFAAV